MIRVPEYGANPVAKYDVIEVRQESADQLGERLGETEKKIIALIAVDKSIPISVMAKKLSISTTAVEKHLKKMKSKGIIERIDLARGGGMWKITD